MRISFQDLVTTKEHIQRRDKVRNWEVLCGENMHAGGSVDPPKGAPLGIYEQTLMKGRVIYNLL